MDPHLSFVWEAMKFNSWLEDTRNYSVNDTAPYIRQPECSRQNLTLRLPTWRPVKLNIMKGKELPLGTLNWGIQYDCQCFEHFNTRIIISVSIK